MLPVLDIDRYLVKDGGPSLGVNGESVNARAAELVGLTVPVGG